MSSTGTINHSQAYFDLVESSPSSPEPTPGNWRRCSQEALQILRSSPIEFLSGSTSCSSNEISTAVLRAQTPDVKIISDAPVDPAIPLVVAQPDSQLKTRFLKIQMSDSDLRKPTAETSVLHFSQALEPVAKLRNRYPDVLPASLDIVSLNNRTTDETAYINASRFEEMILTQGPFINFSVDTVADFWMLAYEQGSDIVCLTDPLVQKSQWNTIEKTFPYWEPGLIKRNPDPSQLDLVYKKIVGPIEQEVNLEVRQIEGPVIAIEPNEKGERVIKRKFDIQFGNQTKRVTHWYFQNWEDQAVCDAHQLAHLIELLLAQPVAPIAHCSAGIGRAGVFAISFKFIKRYLETKQIPVEEEIDQAVIELRKRRAGSVQSPEQLDLIAQTIHAFISKHTANITTQTNS